MLHTYIIIIILTAKRDNANRATKFSTTTFNNMIKLVLYNFIEKFYDNRFHLFIFSSH